MGDFDFDLQNVLRFLVIGIIILSWIGGQFFRAFLRNPQQKEAQRRAAMGQKRPPAQPVQPRPPDQPVERGQRPAHQGLGREIRDFLEGMQREAGQQQRPRPQPVRELDWEAVEPPAPAERLAAAAAKKATRDLPTAAIAPGTSAGEIPTSNPLLSSIYIAPASFELPHWLNVSDITRGRGVDNIRGMSPQDAIVLREIIGPPKAIQQLQALRSRGNPAMRPPPTTPDAEKPS